MAETRRCERCGTEFEPKREHARFCSARCRVAWNRENWNRGNRDQQKWGSENWATSRAAARPPGRARSAGPSPPCGTPRSGSARSGRSDRAQAFAVIGEAVWWVTIVDATLVRYYPDEYDTALAGLPAARRRATETTLARPAVRAEPDGLLRRSRRLHPAARRRRRAAATRRSPSGPGGRCPRPAVATLPPRGPGVGAEPVPGLSGPAGRPHASARPSTGPPLSSTWWPGPCGGRSADGRRR